MYFCSIDQGTSSTRAIVFDMDEATVVADHQIEFKSEYPKPGYAYFFLHSPLHRWVEQDPMVILNTAKEYEFDV